MAELDESEGAAHLRFTNILFWHRAKHLCESLRLVASGDAQMREKLSVLDPTPPIGAAPSRRKHRKEAAQWQCQATIFRINEIKEIAFVS